MPKKLSDYLLFLLIILGFSLRLVGLSYRPVGFTPDEAAFGYNAYSLLLTGKDEWGTAAFNLFFHNLRSFGDYKLPLYSFLAVPTIKFWGLNEFSTRLPNAVFGSLSVVAVYLLAKKLFSSDAVSVFATLFMAFSPWQISLSRGAFESNLVTFFLPIALYLYLDHKYLLSAIFFAINFYTYHTARLITPLILPVLIFFYKPPLNRKTLSALILFLILIFPGIWSYLGAGQGRLSDISIFHPTDNWSGLSDRQFQDTQAGLPATITRLFNNKITEMVSQTSKNYFSYLSPQFLVIQGAGEATYGMIPGRGLIYGFDFILLILALYFTLRQPGRVLVFSFAALLVALVPAAFAKSVGFSANRTASTLPFLALIVGYGFSRLYKLSVKHRNMFMLFVGIVYLSSLAFFAEDYIYHAPRLNAPAMSFGWAEAVNRFKPISSQYSEIKVSRSFSEAQIFLAFYWPVPPDSYQQASASWSDFNRLGFQFLDQYDGYRLGNFRFGNLDINSPVKVPTLLIGKPEEFPENYPYYFQIFSPTGKPVIQVSAKQP